MDWKSVVNCTFRLLSWLYAKWVRTFTKICPNVKMFSRNLYTKKRGIPKIFWLLEQLKKFLLHQTMVHHNKIMTRSKKRYIFVFSKFLLWVHYRTKATFHWIYRYFSPAVAINRKMYFADNDKMFQYHVFADSIC